MPNPFVQRLNEFSQLQEPDVRMLEDLCKSPHEMSSKRYIIRGSNGFSFFPVMMSGWAARHQILRDGGRQITRLMLPGDGYFFDPSQQQLSHQEVVTLSRCKIAYIQHSSIESAIMASSSIGNAMRSYGRVENSILSSSVVSLGRRDALQRMAYLICELHFRLGLIDGSFEDDQFAFPLTQDDLADVLGLTPVHVNRKLQELRHKQIICLRSKKMQIMDLPQLRQIADFNPSYLTQVRETKDRTLMPA